MASCPNCGQAISPEARFCGSCGNVAAPASPTPPAEVFGSTPLVRIGHPCRPPRSLLQLRRRRRSGRCAVHRSRREFCFEYWMDTGSQRSPSATADERNNRRRFHESRSSRHFYQCSACHRLGTNKRCAEYSRRKSSSSGWAPVSAAPVAAQAASPSASSGLNSSQAAALSYLLGPITGVIFLVLDPYKQDRFVRFHAMQSIVYSVACIAFSVVWSVAVTSSSISAGGSRCSRSP